jgi:hypothetical protein
MCYTNYANYQLTEIFKDAGVKEKVHQGGQGSFSNLLPLCLRIAVR